MKLINRLFILILCSLILYSSDAQDELKIDSLIEIYNFESGEELDKLEILDNIIQLLIFHDEENAFDYTNKYLDLAKEQNSIWHIANAFKRKAYSEYHNTNFIKSDLYIDSSFQLLESKTNTIPTKDIDSLKIELYNSRANNLTQQNDIEGSTEMLIKALALCEQYDDEESLVNTTYHIAHNYYYLDDIHTALAYYQKTKQLSAEHQIGNIEASATIMVGQTNMLLDSFDLGRKYYEEAIALADKGNYISAQRFAYLCYSNVFEQANKLDTALIYTLKALDKTLEQPNKFTEIQIYLKLARLYNKQGDIGKSRKYYAKYRKLSDEGLTIGIESEYLIDIAALEKNDGNYAKAFDLLVEGHNLKDSLEAESKLKLIKELELKYDQAQNENKIADQKLQLAQKSKNTVLMGSGLLISILSCLAFYFLLKNAKKKNLITIKDAELKSQKINQLEKEKKLLALNAMLEGQEAERMRIAKDLHDGLGGLLSSVKARLSNINSEVKKIESYNIYEKTTSMVDEACEEVRRISHNLLPGALRLDGLKTAVLQLGEELEESHAFKVNVEMIGFDDRLDETQEIFLYRIIQEATNNIIKYASAKNVLIQLSETDTDYHLIVEDDGKGFDINLEQDGLGLKSMQSRVDHLRGELDISSKLEEGTTISIHIPKVKDV